MSFIRPSLFQLAVVAVLGTITCTPAMDHVRSSVTPQIMLLEQCTNSVRPPQDCVFVQLPLADAEERRLRELIDATRRRQTREEVEAERNGRVTGGVWGFVSYSYRVSFADDRDGDRAWLHMSGRAAWLEGSEQIGTVVFNPTESAELASLLPRRP